MRILVCGGRDFNDWGYLDAVLSFYVPPNSTIVHGDAKGADRLANRWALYYDQSVEAYPADWDKHKKAAGAIRNKEMLDTGIDLVIAFPGGKGTAHMVSIAKKAGVRVIEVPPQ